MAKGNYKVWDCKIVVPADAELPPGFDQPPRSAAIAAVEAAGIEVIGCSSGWGGSLSDLEEELMHENNALGDVYVAGAMDADEGNPQ